MIERVFWLASWLWLLLWLTIVGCCGWLGSRMIDGLGGWIGGVVVGLLTFAWLLPIMPLGAPRFSRATNTLPGVRTHGGTTPPRYHGVEPPETE